MGDLAALTRSYWPDPKAMVAELKAMGMELMVSVWPQVALKSENCPGDATRRASSSAADKGMRLPDALCGRGHPVLTTPPTRTPAPMLWQKIRKNYYDNGVRVFWLDEAEPEYGTYDFDNYRYYSGTVAQTGNLYPQAYATHLLRGHEGRGPGEGRQPPALRLGRQRPLRRARSGPATSTPTLPPCASRSARA